MLVTIMEPLPFEQQVQTQLTDVLDDGRGTDAAVEAASALLGKDTTQYRLMGIRKHSGRAIFYDSTLRKVVSVSFDESGVDSLDKEAVREMTSQPDIERWVYEQKAEYWSWLHPRFGWVFETGRENSQTR